jgi:hypothetical protein
VLPKYICALIVSFSSQGVQLNFSTDVRWSHRRNALESTVCAIHPVLKRVMFRYHIKRKRNRINGTVISAKSCEGEAFRLILEIIKNYTYGGILGIVVKFCVMDGDAKLKLLLLEYFVDAIILRCSNHYVVALKRRVIDKIKGWGTRVEIAFKKSLTLSKNNKSVFIKIFTNYLNHWCGIHVECGLRYIGSKAIIDLKNKKHCIVFFKLQEIIKSVCKDCHLFIRKVTTNVNESIHNSMTKYTDKRKDYKENYSGRTDIAVLKKNHGNSIFLRVMSEMDVPISKYTRVSVNRRDYELNRGKKRKLSVSYKVLRYKNKYSLKKSTLNLKYCTSINLNLNPM